MNVPIWIVIRFQQRDRQDSQNLNNDSFLRSPVFSAQCIIGTEKNLDAGILLILMMIIFLKFMLKLKKFIEF